MKDKLRSQKLLNELVEDLGNIADYLWLKGWAEGSGGNISVNITDMVPSSAFQGITSPEIRLDKSYPEIGDSYFLVTGTGKRLRDLGAHPQENLCLLKVSSTGDSYRLISLAPHQHPLVQPTSELPTHLGIHQMLVKKRSSKKAVIHTHPDELIALTHIPLFHGEKAMNQVLLSMQPESIVFAPAGVGWVSYTLPGSQKLAEATIRKFEQHDVVIWERHGVISVGDHAMDAFDLIDILTKSARIFFMVKNAGYIPLGLSDEDLDALMQRFVRKTPPRPLTRIGSALRFTRLAASSQRK